MNIGKLISLLFLFLVACSSEKDVDTDNAKPFAHYSTHDELKVFFSNWREFQAPELINGIPDYSSETMARQYQELPLWQATLEAIDTTGWSIENQVDWYLIWAEMNGLDFDHRVKKPWANDPRFYQWFFTDITDAPAREGRNMEGAVEYAYYQKPLSAKDQEEMKTQLEKTGSLYQQARKNLTGNGKDIWEFGIKSLQAQSGELAKLEQDCRTQYPKLYQAAQQAKRETDDFVEWLESEFTSKTGVSGIGRQNYTWNLQKVHLVPYTWEDAEILLERELARGHTMLRLAEHKYRNLPPLTEISDSLTFFRRFTDAITEYRKFLESEEIVEVKPYFKQALEQRVYAFTPKTGVRGFFSTINYLDPIIMRTHDYHFIELARIREEPHSNPIRREAPLYNIYDSRAEGLATSMEELMYQAGFLDSHPRSEELIALLIIFRAARGLGGLYQHDLQMTHAEACEFSSRMTPREMVPADGSTITWEQSFYLRQPSYGTSYLLGKTLIEKLISEYGLQKDGGFFMKEFMHELNSRGFVPVSLLYWEMTGDKSMLNKALGRYISAKKS